MSNRKAWWLVGVLLVLSVMPVIGGAVRMHQVAAGSVTAENARFLAAPAPIVIHVPAALLYAVLGALQFVPKLRRSPWHRRAGRVLAALGAAAALSGIWMTLAYPRVAPDGDAVWLMRLFFGAAMLVSLVLGVAAILRRDVPGHEAWMTRAYAIGMGAGTQALTHLPFFIVIGQELDVTSRAIAMGAGWVFNVLVAEWALQRKAAAAAVSRGSPARAFRYANTTLTGSGHS